MRRGFLPPSAPEPDTSTGPATPARPHRLEWLPVGAMPVLLALLGGDRLYPGFLEGPLVPCLALALAPAVALRLVGRPSVGALRVGVTLGLAAYMLCKGMLDPGALRQALERPVPLALGLLLVCLQPLIHSLRWGILLRAQEVRCTWPQVLRLLLVGYFFNTFVPGATGGDLFRAYAVARERSQTEAAITSVLLDRLLGLPPLILIMVVAATWNRRFLSHVPGFRSVLWVTWGVLLVCGLCMCVFWWMGSGHAPAADENRPGLWARLCRAMRLYREHPSALALVMLISGASHLLTIIACICFGLAAGVMGLAPARYFLLVPIGLTVNAIPLAPGGIGQGEVAFARLFAMAADVPANAARGATVMLCLRAGVILTGLAGGVIYALGRHRLDRAMERARRRDDGQAA